MLLFLIVRYYPKPLEAQWLNGLTLRSAANYS